MTSFTKALYNRDPAAAEEFHRQSKFEHRTTFGRMGNLTRAQREPAPLIAGFGRRTPSGVVSCAVLCNHPGCAKGCTLQGRKN